MSKTTLENGMVLSPEWTRAMREAAGTKLVSGFVEDAPWNVRVSQHRNEHDATTSIVMEVRIPDQYVAMLASDGSRQHRLIEYVTSKLHDFVRTTWRKF